MVSVCGILTEIKKKNKLTTQPYRIMRLFKPLKIGTPLQ